MILVLICLGYFMKPENVKVNPKVIAGRILRLLKRMAKWSIWQKKKKLYGRRLMTELLWNMSIFFIQINACDFIKCFYLSWIYELQNCILLFSFFWCVTIIVFIPYQSKRTGHQPSGIEHISRPIQSNFKRNLTF